MMGVGAKRALGLYRSCAPRHKKRQDFSAFALTYILRLSSCRVMGDFAISPLVLRKKLIQC